MFLLPQSPNHRNKKVTDDKIGQNNTKLDRNKTIVSGLMVDSLVYVFEETCDQSNHRQSRIPQVQKRGEK